MISHQLKYEVAQELGIPLQPNGYSMILA
ncbi:small, acid-soluble spore protein, alpha/beta type [Paenibacillus sp. Soil750]